MKLKTFIMTKIQVVVFWVMVKYSDVVGYRRFGGPHCLRNAVFLRRHCTVQLSKKNDDLNFEYIGIPLPEDGGSMIIRNVGIVPDHYTASGPRRPAISVI
jgi:hypothetical protein